MKGGVGLRLGLLAAVGVGLSGFWSPASAVRFEQREVDQSRLVAIAAPVGGTSHQLLILEQLNNRRACWNETGSSPTTVDPVLLNFDFTGVCNRSTDSNGYSLRVGNEDLGLQYSLRVVRQDDDLVLMAVPNRDRNTPPLEVGRTHGYTNGFARIELNPGWRMTKRVYNNQNLGHIYLTHDQDLPTLIAAASTSGGISVPVTRPPVTATPPVATRPSPTPVPPITVSPTSPENLPTVPVSGTPIARPTLPRPSTPPANRPPSSTPQPSNSTVSYRVVVQAETIAQQDQVRAIAPGAFRTQVNGQTVMQAGIFRSRDVADALEQRFRAENLQAMVIPVTGLTPPTSNPGTSSPQTPIARPTIPPTAPTPNMSYRVVVQAETAEQQARVQAIAPGAFRTLVNGQAVMQAGLFRSRDTADALEQQFRAENLQARVIAVTGFTPPTTNPDTSSPQTPIARRVVVIDPGHGGRDPGAIGIGGIQEKDIVFAIAQEVTRLLERQGVQAVMTRQDDRTLDLEPRVNFADRVNADLFVSIHANAASSNANGVETYHSSTSGRQLAQAIQSNIVRATGMNDRGVKQARFYVLRQTSMPAALVEVGFVTGQQDVRRLSNPTSRSQIAGAITDGILQYIQQNP